MLATAIIRTRNNRCSIAWILAVASMTIDGESATAFERHGLSKPRQRSHEPQSAVTANRSPRDRSGRTDSGYLQGTAAAIWAE
jgi:hypothetical protein